MECPLWLDWNVPKLVHFKALNYIPNFCRLFQADINSKRNIQVLQAKPPASKLILYLQIYTSPLQFRASAMSGCRNGENLAI